MWNVCGYGRKSSEGGKKGLETRIAGFVRWELLNYAEYSQLADS